MSPKDVVRDGYDRVSHAYRSGRESAYPLDHGRWVSRLCDGLGPAPRCLDLGCGCGEPVTRLLAARGPTTGVDISPVQVGRARAAVPEAVFHLADFCDLEFPPGSFDAVAAFYSIIHVPVEEQPALLERIGGWLRPGGRLLAVLGAAAWTGTEAHWLGVEGATMYWSHADPPSYRTWLAGAGLAISSEEYVPEGAGGHQFFLCERRPDPSASTRR